MYQHVIAVICLNPAVICLIQIVFHAVLYTLCKLLSLLGMFIIKHLCPAYRTVTVEKEINLAVSYMLKEELEAKGMKVVLTRTTDAGLYEESDS